MTDIQNEKTYWFKRRRYGYGWTPVTWQGWLLIGIFLVMIVVPIFTFGDIPENEFTREVFYYLVYVGALTSLLVYVSKKKGPKGKWRWGKSEEDDPKKDI